MEQMENNPEGKTKQAVLILADFDYFKNVNDQYGHPVGDLVLIKVSSVLLNHVKDGNLAVRWGGEEFLLYLYDTSMEQAYAFTEYLQQEIGKLTIQINGHVIQVTASFGITDVNNETDNSFYSAYKAADAALYEAKNQGRNRTVKAKLQ
jgi:diguanylate cyclase (GGDEF)-like protein